MNTQHLVTATEYRLALISNSVTDEIRQNYLDNLLEGHKPIHDLDLICYVLVRELDKGNFSVEDAFNLLEKEYIGLHLEIDLGDWNESRAFFARLVEDLANREEKGLEYIKEYLSLSAHNEILNVNVCYAILGYLLPRRLVETNVELSGELMNKIKNSTLSSEDAQFLAPTLSNAFV